MTVTDPEMTRFLMSLGESVDLVKYAFDNAQPEELFIRNAPAATLRDLATAVALVPGVREPEIRVIGTRHGEKLYESLLSRGEMAQAEACGGCYRRVPFDGRSLNYGELADQGTPDMDTPRRLHVPQRPAVDRRRGCGPVREAAGDAVGAGRVPLVSPRIAVIASAGLVGWHVRCAARARRGVDVIGLDVTEFADPDLLDARLAEADAVIHLAGVNRAKDEAKPRSSPTGASAPKHLWSMS